MKNKPTKTYFQGCIFYEKAPPPPGGGKESQGFGEEKSG